MYWIIFVTITILLSGFVCRNDVYKILINILMCVAKLYISLRVWVTQNKNNIVFKKRHDIVLEGNTFYVYDYCLTTNGMQNDYKRMSLEILPQHEIDIETNRITRENSILKHNIVNSYISDQDDNCLIDVTLLWRKFLYHFKGTSEIDKIKYFFKYIQRMNQTFDVNTSQFVTYLNDNEFTERRYKITNILDKYFCDVNDY